MHSGPQNTANPKTTHDQEPETLWIPGFYALNDPEVQAAVPRVNWIEKFWAPKVRKNCLKLPQIFTNAVNCRELCKGPSQCRHLKQKKGPLFRNVGKTWAKRGWKRGRNGLESGIPGGMVWFWIFVGAKGLMHANILWKFVKPFQMCTYLLLTPLQNVL